MPKAFMCPYYHRVKLNPDRVLCEGGTRRLMDKQMRRDVVYKFCALNYKECQIYQDITAYYDRQEKPRG